MSEFYHENNNKLPGDKAFFGLVISFLQGKT